MTQLQPHQQRVVDEKSDLDEKRKKLDAFMVGEKFHMVCAEDEHVLLIKQYNAMSLYSQILGERISSFGAKA